MAQVKKMQAEMTKAQDELAGTVVTGSAVSGTFSVVKGLSINSAEHFSVGYGANSVTLTVVSGAN